MIEIDDALAQVLSCCRTLPCETRELGAALGQILAEDVIADVDSPPLDKSIVDGVAVRSEDISWGVELEVLEEITAGNIPSRRIGPGQASYVMTGAPIPEGADAMVMVEQTTLIKRNGGDRVRIEASKFRQGQSIMRRGTAFRQHDQVLRAGTPIRPATIGLMAEVGRTTVCCTRPPRVAVLATGNELVSADVVPQQGQIRNTNGPMLAAWLARDGCHVESLGIALDTRNDLESKIARGLEADILLLSGGVSAGVLDLVPEVLMSLGVRPCFHRVNIKPGKPLWFGYHDHAVSLDNEIEPLNSAEHSPGKTGTRRRTLVFGLPGNPVSSFVSCEFFVRPAIRVLRGELAPASSCEFEMARLHTEYLYGGGRSTLHPGKIVERVVDDHAEPIPFVETLPWKGSADLRTLAIADCLIEFTGASRTYQIGDRVRIRRFDRLW